MNHLQSMLSTTKMKNRLQLNMSLVEEDTNELNETARQTTPKPDDKSITPKRSSRLPKLSIQHVLATFPTQQQQSQQQRSQQSQRDTLQPPPENNNRHLPILQDESSASASEQAIPESNQTSPRSSDDESSEESSSIVAELILQRVNNEKKRTLRMSLLDLNMDGKRSLLVPSSITESFTVVVQGHHVPHRYREELLISKKLVVKNSMLLSFFKKKALGFSGYIIDLDEANIRSRNNTSSHSLKALRSQPQTPTISRKQLFSPSINKQIEFPEQLQSEFFLRASAKARKLKVEVQVELSSEEEVQEKKPFLMNIIKQIHQKSDHHDEEEEIVVEQKRNPQQIMFRLRNLLEDKNMDQSENLNLIQAQVLSDKAMMKFRFIAGGGIVMVIFIVGIFFISLIRVNVRFQDL